MKKANDFLTLRQTLYLLICTANLFFFFVFGLELRRNVFGEAFFGGIFTQTFRNVSDPSCMLLKNPPQNRYVSYKYLKVSEGKPCCAKNWIKEIADVDVKHWMDCKPKCDADRACKYVDFNLETEVCYFCSGCAPIREAAIGKKQRLVHNRFVTYQKDLGDNDIDFELIRTDNTCEPGVWLNKTTTTLDCLHLILSIPECNKNFFAVKRKEECWCILQKDLNCSRSSTWTSRKSFNLYKVKYPPIVFHSEVPETFMYYKQHRFSVEEALSSEFDDVRGFEYWIQLINLELAYKQSVGIFGNLAKFQIIYQKLQQRHCLNILILGGSNTDTRWQNANKKLLWFGWLKRYLNRQFPCNGVHNFVNKAASATNTEWFLNHFEELIRPDPKQAFQQGHGPKDKSDSGILNWDIILCEWTVNDHLTQKTESDTETFFQVMYKNQPDHMPLIWSVELGIGVHMRNPPCHFSTEMLHRRIYHYYQNPMTSVTSVLYWLLRSKFLDEYSCDWKPEEWFPDSFHAISETHWLAGYLLSRHFADMYELYGEASGSGFQDFIPPLMIAKESTIDIVLSHTQSSINFYHPSILDDSILLYKDDSWVHKPETKKEKWGLIANENYSFIQIDIEPSDFVIVEYMETYQAIGNGIIWFTSEKKTQKKLCAKGIEEDMDFSLDWESRFNSPVSLDGSGVKFWLKAAITREVSIPRSVAFLNHRKWTVLNLCTIPSSLGTRFKLLAIISKILKK